MLSVCSRSSKSAVLALTRRRRHSFWSPRAAPLSAVPAAQLDQLEPLEERPRLQALRQRLAQEEPGVGMILKPQKESTTSTQNGSKSPPSKQKKKKEPSVHDILQQLEHTPPIPSQHVLQDSFARQHSYLRISLVERCNLRCRYCMPPEGVPLQASSALLSREEILTLATLFHKHGVDKIRLTGGEPLLRQNLCDIVSDLSTLPNIKQIGMTTNGVSLKRQLPHLVEAGLTHVNISLDSLSEDVFTDLTRRKGLSQVLQSIEQACKILPSGRVKLNVVVMKGINDAELADFCLLSQQLPLDVRFIEWMPFNDNGWNQGRFLSYEKMLQSVSHLQLERIEDGPNDTTKWWKLPSDTTTTEGRIGFITSMSQHFCGTCNRLRLTADGKIKACLFGSSELSLRDALREGASSENIEKLIHYAVQRKTFALGGHGSAQGIAEANDNRPMTLIGG